ncbi:hypothetical protein HanPI659440_Chr13g0485041 [Helianthus annuus]|nr:hypothetical protein HanPI659440_Chr13g0485041 [Helianthus annuus]
MGLAHNSLYYMALFTTDSRGSKDKHPLQGMDWRYRWTKIPKLVFIQNRPHPWTDEGELAALEQYRDRPTERRELFYAIYQVLLIHDEGPIHEFTLDMEVDGSCVEIDHILHHLSKKNTLKILKLDLIPELLRDIGYLYISSLYTN